jgi:hypothetical protein
MSSVEKKTYAALLLVLILLLALLVVGKVIHNGIKQIENPISSTQGQLASTAAPRTEQITMTVQSSRG